MQECDKECKQAGVFKTNNQRLAPSYFLRYIRFRHNSFSDQDPLELMPLRVKYILTTFVELSVITSVELQDDDSELADFYPSS